MDTFDAIEQRRAVKHYDPDHRLKEAEIDQLLAAARRSPTSFNIQNWRFVLVRDPALRREIRAAAWDQAQVTDASLLVILTGDLGAYSHEPARYWRNAPEPVRDFLVGAISDFYKDNPALQRDEVLRSCGIAAQTLMLAAKAMGYDSCPMIGFDQAKVGELINLPADHAIGLMVTIGKATQPAQPRGGEIPDDEAIIVDRFPG